MPDAQSDRAREAFRAVTGSRIRGDDRRLTDYRPWRGVREAGRSRDALCRAAVRTILDDESWPRAGRSNNNLGRHVQLPSGPCLEQAPGLPTSSSSARWASTARPTSTSKRAGSRSSTRAAKDKFLFPRAAGSLYHTTKVLDTDLLWFYVRIYGMRVTDLMQGPVYGLSTPESRVSTSA